MRKIITIIFTLFISFAIAQDGAALRTRSGGAFTEGDTYLAALKSLSIPYGATPTFSGGLQRDGSLFFNTTTKKLVIWNGSTWEDVGKDTDLTDYYTKSEIDNLNQVLYNNAINRSNHTGTQSISTISGLQNELDSKVSENTTITGSGGIDVGGSLATGSVSIGANDTYFNNKYLRKDIDDDNNGKTLTTGGVVSNNIETNNLKLSSLATGGSSDEMLVVDGSGLVKKKISATNVDIGIANATGSKQFGLGATDNLRFAGTGDASVSFNPSTKTVTINSIPGSGTGGAVSSFNSRTGAVVSEAGDYSTTQVTEGINQYFTQSRVRSTPLTGLSTTTNSAITATDNVLQGFGKLQSQINNRALSTRTLTVSGAAGRTIVSGGAQNLTTNREWAVDLAPSGVTAGNYTKVRVDTYGRVTTGSQAAISDITGLQTELNKGNTAYSWGDYREYGLGSSGGSNNLNINSPEVVTSRIFRTLDAGHVGSVLSMGYDGSGANSRSNLLRLHSGNAYISNGLITQGQTPGWHTVYTSGNHRSDSENDGRYLQLTGGSLTGPLRIKGGEGFNLTVERTSSINSSIEAKLTSGSVFFGNSNGDSFNIKGDENINAFPWFTINNSRAIFSGMLDFKFKTNTWYIDDFNNNRIYIGAGQSGNNGILFRAAIPTERVQIRDVDNNISSYVEMNTGNANFNGSVTASYFNGSLNASQLSLGTVPFARIPTGTTSTTVAIGNDSRIVNATPNTRTITAGDGLTGGGNLTANRSISVDNTVVRTSGNQTISGSKTFNSSVSVGNATADNHAITLGQVNAMFPEKADYTLLTTNRKTISSVSSTTTLGSIFYAPSGSYRWAYTGVNTISTIGSSAIVEGVVTGLFRGTSSAEFVINGSTGSQTIPLLIEQSAEHINKVDIRMIFLRTSSTTVRVSIYQVKHVGIDGPNTWNASTHSSFDLALNSSSSADITLRLIGYSNAIISNANSHPVTVTIKQPKFYYND